MRDLERPMRSVIPDGCTWVEDDVVAVDAESATVRTRGGRTIGYGDLVVCPAWSRTGTPRPASRRRTSTAGRGPRSCTAVGYARGRGVAKVPAAAVAPSYR